MHCCPAAEGCALAALCARSEGQAALCVRQAMRQGVQGSRQVCAERWKDSSCSCCRGDQETALVLASTQRPLLEGLPAQRHRSASLVEEEPASREAPQQHIAASSKRCPGHDATSLWGAAAAGGELPM